MTSRRLGAGAPASVARERHTRLSRFDRIDALFDRAVDVPEADRENWLSRECDDEFRDEVRSLLVNIGNAATALRGTVVAAADAFVRGAPTTQVGARIGAYRLVEVIGEGG